MPNSKPVAVLYRMKTPEHICPFGLRSRALLRRKGFDVDDRLLTSREEAYAFKAEQDVKTTPQTFIDGQRVGGHEDLRRYLGLTVKDKNRKTYTPVIAIFASAALMALGMSWTMYGTLLTVQTAEWFIAISMCLLAVQKLRDLDSFTNTFLGYDLLARRHVRYAYIYPFAELLAGVLMIAGALMWFAAPLALFIGAIGAVSVYRAVYVEKRDLKCACVGGNSNVPLGFVSLLENVMMVVMAVWMLLK
jgi:glutaredoxin